MKFLYSLSIRFYALAVGLVSLWNPKAKLWIDGRKKWLDKLEKALVGKENIQWFHCASLGEFEQARPLIEKIKNENSNASILVTFFSPSGYQLRKNYALADYVCYLPLDTKSNAKKIISTLNISKVYFVKYEVWPHFFRELKTRNIPFYLISATFREGQIYFKPAGNFFKKILELPTQIFVQEVASQEILKSNNITSLVAGDTRYDSVWANSQKATANPIIEEFTRSKFTLIAGSSWEKEEEMICKAFFDLNQCFKVVFAPHDISESHVKGIMNRLKKHSVDETKIIRYSEIKEGVNLQRYELLILDNIGLLSNAYQYGSAAFVGGGFTNALHNILEPATFGLPVFYGDNHPKFPEGELMAQEGAGFRVSTSEQFQQQLSTLIQNKVLLKEKQEENKLFIKNRIGATALILDETR